MRLRHLEAKDAQAMLGWMHDPQVYSVFATDFSSFNIDKVLNFIETAQDNPENLHFACVDEQDDYLGTVSLKSIDRKANNAEYAISFCSKAHGTGAASYATSEILRIAFEELGLERVYLNVLKDNLRANSFYKKFGFKYEGTFRKHMFINGNYHDLCWYSILKEEFKAG